ncbi:efflux transporter, HAE1 family, outer membrane efflux protein [Cystobacter fuscus DSM 2262]|uniref:Efflux transporter, HAE1 family, outer membrane efflux protein n=1 Tax=Cystobacter fuscus (strain ATCC 25194 / DSM 2262 / NBRC 100088 / M29) TaxID=1242864 RepID=S9PD91_CYSF2|nr:TolC family protein [Cystobacter fuscus]EPX60262.1 efflux transporter, HAE1 family, outer membrane efflux protein [Cystobacter fuscus DSM 2262]
MTSYLFAAVLSHVVLAPGVTLAQASPAPAPPPEAATQPPQPEVSDPMLAPVAPAPIQVGSWDEALQMLRQRSTELGTALARVESASGQRRVELAGLLPTLNGSASVQYNLLGPTVAIGGAPGNGAGGGGAGGGVGGLTTTSPLGTANVAASLPLFDLQAVHSLRAADATRQAAEFSLDETRRQLTRTLAQTLAQVAASERLAEVNRVNLRSSLERLALAQRRMELGAGTRLDVIRLEQDAEAARAQVVSGDESLRQARDALGLLLGSPQPVGLGGGLSLEELINRGQRECRALQELQQRPDQAAARAQVEAAERQVSAARSQYLPTLQAQSSVTALTVDPGFARVPIWNIGAVLTLPFYDGGVREGLVWQARAQEDIARQAAVNVERSATVEVRRVRRNVDVAGEQQRIAQRARELAAENDRLTRRSFEVGAGTSQDLVVSAAALRQAELNLVVSELQFFQARIESFLVEAACDW